MITHILRFRAKDKDNFLEIKRGLKSVETRAATERYRKIKAGDALVFVCGKSRIKKRVKTVKVFRTIAAMVGAVNYKKIMPSLRSPKEMEKVYFGYSGYREKIKKHGLIAFWM